MPSKLHGNTSMARAESGPELVRWENVPVHGVNAKQYPGLAISGGLDSMALAQLCHMVQWGKRQEYSLKPRFHALIVDHKSREGSSEEAQLTALRLEQLSMSRPK